MTPPNTGRSRITLERIRIRNIAEVTPADRALASAGYTASQIAPLFKNAPGNCELPDAFDYFRRPKTWTTPWTWNHSMLRTDDSGGARDEDQLRNLPKGTGTH